MRFRKPELIPILFIVAAEVTLLGLGCWQLARLEWKTELLATIETAQAEPVLKRLPQDVIGLDYRNVDLPGQFVSDKTLQKVGGKQGERPGFFLLAPFKLAQDGRIILVNRGFLPQGEKAAPAAKRIQGVLRPPRARTYFFLPENQPDKNIWLYEDMNAMSRQLGLEVLPLIVEATGAPEKGAYPIPNTGNIAMRNDHLGYALTWFALAVIGLVCFMFYHRIPEEKT